MLYTCQVKEIVRKDKNSLLSKKEKPFKMTRISKMLKNEKILCYQKSKECWSGCIHIRQRRFSNTKLL